jgi:RNA polymerase sigma-70 factor (ECF subfamily)
MQSDGVHAVPVIPAGPVGMLPHDSLVARAAGGDDAAFRLLFERHAGPIRRFLRDLLRDDAAADDATQETFVRAHRRLHTLAADQKLLPWLFGIARNVFYEQLRARNRPRPSPDQDSHGDTPEHRILAREADRKLQDALATLSHERRAALLLRVDHELGYEEIGRIMNWSLAKVKNEIHRGRLELREQLSGYLEGAQ